MKTIRLKTDCRKTIIHNYCDFTHTQQNNRQSYTISCYTKTSSPFKFYIVKTYTHLPFQHQNLLRFTFLFSHFCIVSHCRSMNCCCSDIPVVPSATRFPPPTPIPLEAHPYKARNMAPIPRVGKLVRETNLVEDSLEVIKVIRPHWIEEKEKNGVEIRSKMFTDGITNKLIGFNLVTDPKDVVIIKVYGANTELMIDRQAEIDTMTLLNSKKCGPKPYALFDNGLAYEFIHGVTLTMESCRSPKVYPIVAAEMARVHSTVPVITSSPGSSAPSALWKKSATFLELNKEILGKNSDLASRLSEEYGYTADGAERDINEMKELLEKESIPVAFCHNDILLGNVVYNEATSSVAFIDFEYAMPNYVTFDLANHFNEFAGIDNPDFRLCPDAAFRRQFIEEYLKTFGGGEYSVEQFEKWVDLCIPASHLFWALWAVVQAENSTIDFDFAGYVGLRYTEFKRHMEEIRGKKAAS